MNDNITALAAGFTPLIDELVDKYDLITAAVFGRIWRYCQMDDKVCRASQETIAAELKLSTRTVMRKIDDLTQGGYLIDTTPDQRFAPHVYQDSGALAFQIELKIGKLLPPPPPMGVDFLNTHHVTQSHMEGAGHVTQSQMEGENGAADMTLSHMDHVTQSQLKIQLLKKQNLNTQPSISPAQALESGLGISPPGRSESQPPEAPPPQVGEVSPTNPPAAALSEWDILGAGREVKNPSAAAALAAHQIHKQNHPDLSWADEDLWPLVECFITKAGIPPTAAEHKFWNKMFRDMAGLHINQEDIEKAIRKVRKDGLTIGGPMSILRTARDCMAQRIGPGAPQFNEVF